MYTSWTYAIFLIFWNDFMNKKLTKSQQKVDLKSTKSQFLINKKSPKINHDKNDFFLRPFG